MKTNKFQKTLVNTGSFIGNNKVALLYVGAGVLVVALAIPLVKNLYDRFKGRDTKEKKDIMGKIKVDWNKATITSSQADQMANQLLDAFSVSSGTDNDVVIEVFDKLKNDDDFYALFKAFGYRTYSNVNSGSPTEAVWGVLEDLGGYDDMDLMGWLNTELSWYNIGTKKKVRAKLPKGYVLA